MDGQNYTEEQPQATITYEQARAAVEAHETERLAACQKEIQEVLDRYGFQISVTPSRALITPKG